MFYIGDIVNIPVIVGESYLPYRISVPNDFVIGSLAFGGNQFKNHAVVVDPYISTKVDTEIDPGRTFTIEHSEGFHHVALKAGSKFHAELIGYEIMDYTLEEDISFYGMGLPYYGFNATQVDPVSFNDDGTVNFTFEEEQTDVYSINAEINLETVADDGYAFDKWVIEKYDDPGNELIPVYDVKKITPTFTKIPQPAPTPEEPEYVNGQTGDNVPLMTIVLLAVVTIACFGV